MEKLYKTISRDSYNLDSKLTKGCPDVTEIIYYSPEKRYNIPQTAFTATTTVAYHEGEGEDLETTSLYVYLADYEIPADSKDPWATEAGTGDHMLFLEFHTESDTEIAEGTYDVKDESSPSRSQFRVNHEGDKTHILTAAQISSEITHIDEESVCGTVNGKDEYGALVKGVFKANRLN